MLNWHKKRPYTRDLPWNPFPQQISYLLKMLMESKDVSTDLVFDEMSYRRMGIYEQQTIRNVSFIKFV